MYRQFNIQQFYVLPTQCIYVFCVDLRTNSDYFPIQYEMTGFYSRDEVCLLRGTDWIFTYQQFTAEHPLKSLFVCARIELDKESTNFHKI